MQEAQKKPATPKKDQQKRPPKKYIPLPNEGRHSPFAAEMGKLAAEENKIREEARTKAEAERKEAEIKRKEAEQRLKFASVYAYADEIKNRHPDAPEALLAKIKISKSGGEAKRLVRDWMIEKAKVETQQA